MKNILIILFAFLLGLGTYSCNETETVEPVQEDKTVNDTVPNDTVPNDTVPNDTIVPINDTVFSPTSQKIDHLTADTGKVFYVKGGDADGMTLVFKLDKNQPSNAKLIVTDTVGSEFIYDIYHMQEDTIAFGSPTGSVTPSFEGVYIFSWTSEDSLAMSFRSDNLGRSGSVQSVKASTTPSIDTTMPDDTTQPNPVNSVFANFFNDLEGTWDLDTGASIVIDTNLLVNARAYIIIEKQGREAKVTTFDGNRLAFHFSDSTTILDASLINYDYMIQVFQRSNPIREFYMPNLQASNQIGWYITMIDSKTIKVKQTGSLFCRPCAYTQLVFTKR